jgi:hypothetical protein
VDWYPVAVIGGAGLAAAGTFARLLNRPTVIGRIIGLAEKVIDRGTQVKLKQEGRITEIALEQERRITEIAREQEKRLTEVALESERRATQIMVEQEKRMTEVARGQERRARLTAVASAVPSGGVLTDRAGDESSTLMRNLELDLGSSPDDIEVSVIDLSDSP